MGMRIIVKGSLFLLFLLFLKNVESRVSVAADGSITLAASQTGNVHIQGDLVVQQRSIATELNNIAATLTNANQLSLYSFNALRWQSFNIPSSRSAKFFTSGTESYLVVANAGSVAQYLYHWNVNTNSFDLPTLFNTTTENAFEVFTIQGNIQIIDAPSVATTPSIRQWNPAMNSFSQSGIALGVSAPTYGWTFYNTNVSQFLAQATEAGYGKSIYKWNGASWLTVLTSNTVASQSRDWNFFSIGNIFFAVLSFSGTGTSSEIYVSTDGSTWQFNGTLPTTQAYASKSFQSKGNTFLVFAENSQSQVYMWNGLYFQLQFTFSTPGARGVELFSIGNQIYCYISNSNDGVTFMTPSQLYTWNPYLLTFNLVSQADSTFNNNWSARFFTVNNKNYLYTANSASNLISYVYKLGIV